MSNKLLIGINISIFLILFIIVLAVYFTVDKNNLQKLNDYYKNIKDNYPVCFEYLQTVAAFPSWRLSAIFGFFATIIIGVYLLLIFSIKNCSITIMFWLILWFVLFINVFVIYKVLSLWNWHYMCDDGCVKYSIW